MRQMSFKGFLKQEDIINPELEVIYLLEPEDDIFVRNILPRTIRNAFTIQKLEWEDFVGKVDQDSCWIAHCYWNVYYSYTTIEIAEKPQQIQEIQTPLQQKKLLPPVPKPVKKTNRPPSRNSSPSRSSSRNQSPGVNERLNTQFRQSRDQSPKYQKIPRSISSSSLQRSKSQRITYKFKVTSHAKLLERSWARHNKDDYLLEHETGHYLIGCLLALEFKRQAELLVLDQHQNQEFEIKKLFKDIFKTFLQIERNYDDETQHYCDEEMQCMWNRKIKEQILLYEQYFAQN